MIKTIVVAVALAGAALIIFGLLAGSRKSSRAK
jgi:hypothetical protein